MRVYTAENEHGVTKHFASLAKARAAVKAWINQALVSTVVIECAMIEVSAENMLRMLNHEGGWVESSEVVEVWRAVRKGDTFIPHRFQPALGAKRTDS